MDWSIQVPSWQAHASEHIPESPFCDVTKPLTVDRARIGQTQTPLESYRPARWQGNVMDFPIIAIILLGGAAVAGVAYLLEEFQIRRDFDWN